ncbi:MAG: hypothetical protein JKY27_03080 [Magnetovibrio sp.]|nr:hypothetical protein [Magnetovibrio sp.]
MLKILPVFAFMGLLMTAPAVHAQEDGPQELFEGATRMVMQAMELLIKAVPQYEPPVILDNGYILIRRKRDDDDQNYSQPGADQDRI